MLISTGGLFRWVCMSSESDSGPTDSNKYGRKNNMV